jgi:hypothetical protein
MGWMLVLATPALAHEEREVGMYAFAVGFGDEPAYAGLKNSVQLILSGPGDRPVTDLTDTLKVEVQFGDQKLSLPLEPNFEVGEFGIPGDYRAWFFPTRPGTYSFHFTGTIKGQNVDETFTSGPTTFDEVVEPSAVEFPVKDPNVAQLAGRLGRELPRLTRTAQAGAERAHDAADSARLIAFLGVGLGVLGLIVGSWGLVTARRTRAESVEGS